MPRLIKKAALTQKALCFILLSAGLLQAAAQADVIVLKNGNEAVGLLQADSITLQTPGSEDLIIPLESIRTLHFEGNRVTARLSDGRQIAGVFSEPAVVLKEDLMARSFPVDDIVEIRVTAHDETFPLPIEEIDPKLQYPPRQERLVFSIPLSELREFIAFRRQLDNLPIADARIKNLSILRENSGRRQVSLDLKLTVEVGRSHDREVEVEISAADGATQVQGVKRRFEVEEEKTRTVSLTVKLDREFFESAVSNQGRLQISITVHDD